MNRSLRAAMALGTLVLAPACEDRPVAGGAEPTPAVRIASAAPSKTEVRLSLPMTAAHYRRFDSAARERGERAGDLLRAIVAAELERAELEARLRELGPGDPVILETIVPKSLDARLRTLARERGTTPQALVGEWIDAIGR